MIELRRPGGRFLRIGHRGAAALAPENTIESLRRAVELGCDLVEFDVVLHEGRLVLAHSLPELGAEPASLDEALAFLAAAGSGVHVDLKAAGAEADVVESLRNHGLVERTLITSFRPSSLRLLRGLESGLCLGLTYPEDRTGLAGRRRLAPLVRGTLTALRKALPRRIGGMLRGAGATVAALHWAVVDRPVVDRCHALGAPVVVWTVDDPSVIRELDELAVEGVVTNDPRLFGARLAP